MSQRSGLRVLQTSLPGGLQRSGMILRPGKSVRHLPGTFPGPDPAAFRISGALPGDDRSGRLSGGWSRKGLYRLSGCCPMPSCATQLRIS